MGTNFDQLPQEFGNAREQVLSTQFRSEISVEEIKAPDKIAPYSLALAAGIKESQHAAADMHSDLGAGRFVLLYDPNFSAEWQSHFRVICFAQVPFETEIATDHFIAEVAWAWLSEALERAGAEYTNIAGTSTTTVSTGFGGLSSGTNTAHLEMRASWSPLDNDFSSHARAWSELLCLLAGFPQQEGALSLDSYRNTKQKKPGDSN